MPTMFLEGYRINQIQSVASRENGQQGAEKAGRILTTLCFISIHQFKKVKKALFYIFSCRDTRESLRYVY
jgi:hypothetical protein